MNITQFTNPDLITQLLSPLLGMAIAKVQIGDGEGLPETVHTLSVFDESQNEHRIVLKHQENDVAYRLYQQYLEPYHLNSPKEYGYIEMDGQHFLVMDYIQHLPTRWEDRTRHLSAVEWLVKKDRITQQNMDYVRSLDCLGEMPYSGVDYWLSQFEKWHQVSTSNGLAKEVVVCVTANWNRINEYIGQLNEDGVQTIVHGDLALDNILFGKDESGTELYVIDWTQPHIGSVTQDLVSLYDTAPDSIKSEIIETYKKCIDFPQFDDLFAKAKVLRNIGYLSWMAWMISVGEKEEEFQPDLDRVTRSLILSLE